jgi:hypothetical protein
MGQAQIFAARGEFRFDADVDPEPIEDDVFIGLAERFFNIRAADGSLRKLEDARNQQTPATASWNLNGLKVGDTTPTKISFQRITDLPSIDD